RGIPTGGLVAMQLLDPFQVDDRRDADQQVDVPGNVDFAGHHGAVQALIEEQVRIPGNLLPRREGAGLLTMARGLHIVVQVLAHLAGSAAGIAVEELLQLREQIRLRAKVAEPLIPAGDRLRELLLHARTVITVEAVAFDEGGRDVLAAEDLLEGLADRGGAGPRRAGDGNDRMTRGHGYRLGQTCLV